MIREKAARKKNRGDIFIITLSREGAKVMKQSHAQRRFAKFATVHCRIVALILIILLGLVLHGTTNPVRAELVEGGQAPEFTLPDALGGTVSLSDYLGTRPVLLYFHMAVG
ncbi:redoxin domain-containing protein [candidate division KSB3 bacterium]|uniref:Redoxin domain-containing protein n=1 Tax=candidate division KSB3 bacterium TaxID=2044937 RepID=A0A9D5JS87_9BACT|nr:redoxin domain-containing protein [candidate division KSB3 bacterium]MBD3323059.1 redoxin domain-containing protein [candidate division KSB3 bacterium]